MIYIRQALLISFFNPKIVKVFINIGLKVYNGVKELCALYIIMPHSLILFCTAEGCVVISWGSLKRILKSKLNKQ